MPQMLENERDYPHYREKRAMPRDSNASDSIRNSVEVPASGSLIKFTQKKSTLISHEQARESSDQGDSREGNVRSTSRPNEEQVHSCEKDYDMNEMVKAGELRS